MIIRFVKGPSSLRLSLDIRYIAYIYGLKNGNVKPDMREKKICETVK